MIPDEVLGPAEKEIKLQAVAHIIISILYHITFRSYGESTGTLCFAEPVHMAIDSSGCYFSKHFVQRFSWTE